MAPRSTWLAILSFAALLFAGFAARPAAAIPATLTACEEDGHSDEVQATPEPARMILPCSLAEHAFVSPSSGDPSCADAAIYLVTDAGVLLCQIDVSALASSSLPHIEKAPPATFATSTAFSAGGIPAVGAALPPPLVVDLAAVPGPAPALPRDGFGRPPPVPS